LVIKGKVFIVTGASSGIGKQLSKSFAKSGAHVVCAARRKDHIDSLSDSIKSFGGSSLAVQTDVTILKECANMIEKTMELYGRIDCLVLNAGISMWSKFEKITNIEFFDDLIKVNYLGAVNCCYTALPHLKKTNGKIVSTSTAQALIGFPNHSGYVASKHALHGFLSTLAMEHRGEISVLEAVLSWIRGTNLRNNAFEFDGSKDIKTLKKHTKESVSLNDCVEKIIQAIKDEKREIYIPGKLRLLPFLNLFFKNYLERKVKSAIDENIVTEE
tara:strand:- start:51770 stop:52585 length:816 start_codon:yes stop_codon:yes gene_type:complete